jgi:beta-lactamase class A
VTDPTAALAERAQAQLDALDAKTSMYASHLPSGREIAIRADEPVNTLSIIKLVLMALAYQDAEAGTLELDRRYVIRPQDLRRGSGLLQTFAPGLQPTYRDLVVQMIITSDNTATDILAARLGLERVNAMLAEFGYRETRLQTTTGQLFRRLWEMADPKNAALTDEEVFARGFPTDPQAAARHFTFEGNPAQWLGKTTAREISRFLEQIENGELASRPHCDEMLDMLRRQFYSSRLPQRIVRRAPIGHKTGDWPPVAGNDAGIIYSPSGPIVVSIFATQNRGDFFELEATHGRIAEMLLDSWGEP